MSEHRLKASKSVLVVGVYLSDKPNLAVDITANLLGTRDWQVECRWAALGAVSALPQLAGNTYFHHSKRLEKSKVINQLLSTTSIDQYEYIIVCDDDISLPEFFLDQYLQIAARRQFSLSQPARSHNSFIDHYFVAQLHGIESRRTNFIEIGPLFCAHKSCFSLLFPLDEAAPMGWGLDFVWPKLLESHGLMMGIVDKLCVNHSLRKPVSFYDYSETDQRMKQYFQLRPHLTYEQSFRTFESYLEGQ